MSYDWKFSDHVVNALPDPDWQNNYGLTQAGAIRLVRWMHKNDNKLIKDLTLHPRIPLDSLAEVLGFSHLLVEKIKTLAQATDDKSRERFESYSRQLSTCIANVSAPYSDAPGLGIDPDELLALAQGHPRRSRKTPAALGRQ